MNFKKNKKRNIQFATEVIGYDNSLVPSKTKIPEWYKKTLLQPKDSFTNRIPLKLSFKACAPFLESLTSGYMLLTPCDIGVDNLHDIDTYITWNPDIGYQPVDIRRETEQNSLLPIPEGMSTQHFTWDIKVCLKIPEGYSVLITHPLNRNDLPFTTLSAIIDGAYLLPGGSIPFFIKKSFNGIIPKGTPFAQVIPFKRENWHSEKNVEILKEQKYNQRSSSSSLNWYKANHWRKKTYE